MSVAQQTRNLYRKRAGNYNQFVRLYPVFGINLPAYRRLAVDALALKPGDTAIDIGCGTGLNLPLLRSAVGSDGMVIGVDLTDRMLWEARTRVRNAGWRNVYLVEADAAIFVYPRHVNGILSTLAITLIPEYDTIIRHGASALAAGGRFAVLDLKEPAAWPRWLVRFAAWLNRPYGVSLTLAHRHPWESVRRYLRELEYSEFYAGALYLSVGQAKEVIRPAPKANNQRSIDSRTGW